MDGITTMRERRCIIECYRAMARGRLPAQRRRPALGVMVRTVGKWRDRFAREGGPADHDR